MSRTGPTWGAGICMYREVFDRHNLNRKKQQNLKDENKERKKIPKGPWTRNPTRPLNTKKEETKKSRQNNHGLETRTRCARRKKKNVMHAYIKHATNKVWGRGEVCHDDGEGDTGGDTVRLQSAS